MIKLPKKSFLQSVEWESFQQALGLVTTRVADQLLIKHPTMVGDYWYCPRPELKRNIFEKLSQFLSQEQSLFIRVDPNIDDKSAMNGSRYSVASTQPQDTLVLKLDKTEQLLTSFHPKTRYNVKLAQKKGLRIEFFNQPNREIEDFLQLARLTALRQGIRFHPAHYYRSMLGVLSGQPSHKKITANLAIAYWQDQPIAANIVLWHYPWVYYLHGATDNRHRQLMAPYLLQWQTMLMALKAGFRYYDFWGIAPTDPQTRQFNPKHPWSGITRFKLGFGGEVVHFPNSYDLVTSLGRYRIYRTLLSIKKLLRFL